MQIGVNKSFGDDDKSSAELNRLNRAATADAGSAMAELRGYFQMTKPSISLLVAFTVVPTLFMAAEQQGGVSFWLAFCAVFGTYLASSSAGIFNHIVDSDIDSTMDRTRKRPLPSGRVHKGIATFVAVALGLGSYALLYTQTSPLAAHIALLANFFYVVIYTIILKRRTSQNIVIGGAAGSVGPLIGWAAVSGTIAWPAWVLFMVVFLWTPPHFWALAIKYKDDYSAAGVPMLPSVKGVKVTQKQIFYYTLALVPTVGLLLIDSAASYVYALISIPMTLYFCYLAYKLLRTEFAPKAADNEVPNRKAMEVFFFSLIYVFGVFGSLIIDRAIAHWLS